MYLVIIKELNGAEHPLLCQRIIADNDFIEFIQCTAYGTTLASLRQRLSKVKSVLIENDKQVPVRNSAKNEDTSRSLEEKILAETEAALSGEWEALKEDDHCSGK